MCPLFMFRSEKGSHQDLAYFRLGFRITPKQYFLVNGKMSEIPYEKDGETFTTPYHVMNVKKGKRWETTTKKNQAKHLYIKI